MKIDDKVMRLLTYMREVIIIDPNDSDFKKDLFDAVNVDELIENEVLYYEPVGSDNVYAYRVGLRLFDLLRQLNIE